MADENLILLNKPFGVLTQFTGDEPNLSQFVRQKGFYAAGRLDKDSEGLVVLTNDGALQARISQPAFKMEKTYWVQVEGEMSEESMTRLRAGVALKDGMTQPAKVRRISPELPTRVPDIRYRASIPTSWLEIVLKEGRNRQVRRMTAAVGFPTLRLFRYGVGVWTVDGLDSGSHRMLKWTPDRY